MAVPSEQPGVTDPLEERLAQLGAESPALHRLRELLPWVLSPLIHVLLILVGFVITWSVVAQRDEEHVEIVADLYAQSFDPLAKMEPQPEHESPRLADTLIPSDIIEPTPIDESMLTEIDPLQTFSDARAMSSLAEFAPRAAEGSASFVGLKATNARRIVYVIDASGSMLRSLKYVIDELARSLEGLTQRQSYAIVFYQRAEATVVPPAGQLVRADSDAKRRSLEWINAGNVFPQGSSNPLAAIETALKLKPDAIFLLSDNITGGGQFEIDQSDLLDMLDRLNPVDRTTGKRTVQINCIQFLDPDPLNTLKIIADMHGGENGYRFLDRAELGLAAP